MQRTFRILFLALLGTCTGALADPFSGQKEITLRAVDGTEIAIGHVTFHADSATGTATYDLDLARDVFAQHFLSMRPFRCLEGPRQHWCHLPYPYDIDRRVSDDDLTDLEYDLLFAHKGAPDYGIDMWNGLYFKLSVEGDQLSGHLFEVDMGLLAIPPAPGARRPIGPADIHDTDPDAHWLPEIIIR